MRSIFARFGRRCGVIRSRLASWASSLPMPWKKNAPESKGGDPLCQMVTDLWKPEFEAYLTEGHHLAKILKEGMDKHPGGPRITFTAPLDPYTKLKRGADGRVEHFEDTRALNRIQKNRMDQVGLGMYDPQADEPLDPHNEAAMEQMGPAAFLQWLCKNYNRTVTPIPQTDFDCARSARIVMRSIKSYFGERYIQ